MLQYQRAHSFSVAHMYPLLPDTSVAWVQYSQTSSYTDNIVYVCINLLCMYCARKALGVCSLFISMCVCVFFVLLTSVSPLICRDSAVLMKAGRASCLTFTSPQYINWIRSFSAE